MTIGSAAATSRTISKARRPGSSSPSGRGVELTAASGLLPRLIVLALLISSAGLGDSPGHAHSHWLLIAGYAMAAAFVGLTDPTKCGGWATTLLDGALAGYVVVEHLAVPGAAERAGTDAISQLPAFLLLLSSGLALRLDRTAAFAAIVVVGWIGAIGSGHLRGGLGASALGHQAFGLSAFVAATAFVLHGVGRLRTAMDVAIKAERERSFLSRFVPPGTDLDRFDGAKGSDVRAKHACLMSVDIRGFSELSRRHPSPDVLRWLLEIRVTVNTIVSTEGGTVDKYVGDAVLAQFFEGDPHRQARAAMAAALAIRARLEGINGDRAAEGLPEIRLVTALHSGTVLAGILDDGLRSELTVLGPAMNALSRIERRAKEDDIDILVSKRFAGVLGEVPGFAAIRLSRHPDDREAPDMMRLIPDRGGRSHPISSAQLAGTHK